MHLRNWSLWPKLVLIFLATTTYFTGLSQGDGFTCEEAACLSENLGVTLNNGNAPPTPPLSFSCGVTHNNLFYSFCPETGPVTLDITPSNCTVGDGVQAIIYETDDCVNFIEHACVSNGNVDPFSISFTGEACNTYILMIDGFLGDVCDFTVTADGIQNIVGPPDAPILDPDDNPLILCNGEDQEINVTNDDQCCTAYFWEVRTGTGVISLDVDGSSATINTLSEGFAELCVKADNFCEEAETCIEVEVIQTPMIDPISPIEQCDGEFDFCDYNNFFDPPLNPNPDDEGWTVSFHETQADAENNENPIACPYVLSTFGSATIWIRVAASDFCFSVESFEISYINCCEAEAGSITATPNDVCPGETISISVTGYQNSPTHTQFMYEQYILVADNTGLIIEVIAGDMHTLTSDVCAEYTVYSYNLQTGSSSPAPFVGMDPSTIDCADPDGCCDLESIIVRWVDSEPPTFDNPPVDLVLNCFDGLTDMMDLDWTDNCFDPGISTGSESGSADLCNGGTITRTWEAEDGCGNMTSHSQTITVNPPLPIVFTTMPPNETVACENIPGDAGSLSYTNNGSGDCLFEGTADPQRTDNYDICGGDITNLWEATDPCGNTISYTQVITVQPSTPPVFLNPPGDITMACDNFLNEPDDLEYRNNSSGDCLIEGSVSATSTPEPDLCGGIITNTWEFTDPCGRVITHVQNVTKQQAPAPAFLDAPSDITIECDEPTPMPDLLYTNDASGDCLIEGQVSPILGGDPQPCPGVITVLWEYTDPCGRYISHRQNITREPAPMAEFLDFPPDITIACTQEIQENDQLEYSNFGSGECLIEGVLTAIRIGGYDACGGYIDYYWQFTDQCGRSIEYTQTITVEPAESAEFLDFPQDEEILCSEIPETHPSLPYSNFDPECPIKGEIAPMVTSNYDSCGGEIIYQWEFTDPCGHTIRHSQILDILPVDDPEFVDPPDDIELACGEDVPSPTPLFYTNYESGDCELSGFVMPTIQIFDQEIEYIYTFENECTGTVIEHIQYIFDPLEPEIFIDPIADTICQNQSYDLANIQVFEENNINYYLTYHDGTPPDSGNEIFDLTVSPSQTTTYYIAAHSDDDCLDIEEFTLFVIQPPYAGEDNAANICFGSDDVNLFDYLINADNQNGDWTDPLFSGVDISDPTSVNFSAESPGVFVFEYILSSGSCSPDTARIELTLLEELIADIRSVLCSPDRNSYIVEIVANGNIITVNAGNLTGPVADVYTVDNIPIGQNLEITIQSPTDNCLRTIVVSAPNCDCPEVEPPVSDGNQQICQGDPTPTLSVTVTAGNTANWYDAPFGGNLLLQNSTTYLPTETEPGIYTFYVDAQSIAEPDCRSNTRTPVILEISSNPTAQSAELELCDDDDDGSVVFTLSDAEVDLGLGVPGLRYEYYLNRTSAEAGTNPVNVLFSNTVNPQTLFVVVSNSSNCDTIVELELNVNPLPDVQVSEDDESCLGLEDGQVEINGSGDNPPFEYSINDFFYFTDNTFDSLAPGMYNAYVRDSKGCVDSIPFEIGLGLELAIDLLEIECFDNNTDTDPNDDFYELRFTVSNNLALSANYELFVEGNSQGTFAYGAQNVVQINASGIVATVRFVDVGTGCFVETTIGPLTSCSSDCELTINNLEYECMDNGTPLDPTDDFYTVSLNISALNGSSSNQYRVFIDGNRIGIYGYDTDIQFDIPADGSNVTMTIEDLDDDQCRENINIGPLDHCSNDCLVEGIVVELICDDNGTLGFDDDDTFTIELSASSINASSRWFVLGGTDTLDYGSSTIVGSYLITDGNVELIIIDALRPECRDTLDIEPPGPCSNPCEIELVNLVISDCDDNQTGPITTDDFYSISFQINANFGPTSDYIITDGVNNWGPFAYNTPVMIDNLPADGNVIVMSVLDTMSQQCNATFEVEQDPCSSCDQVVDAGSNQLITCADPVVTLTGSSSEQGTYLWTGPNNFTSNDLIINVDRDGRYYFTVTYPNQCIKVDSVDVALDAGIPVADAGPDQTLNCIVLSVQLDGSLSSSGANITYEWQDENGNVLSTDLQYNVTDPGSYYLVAIDESNNCRSPRDLVVVDDNRDSPDGVIYADPGNSLDCVIESIILSTNNEEHVIYTWTVRGEDFTGDIKVVVDSGYVSLYALDTISGCDTLTGINIEDFTEYPFVTLDDPDPIDCYSPTTIIDATRSQRTQDLLIEWTDESGSLINDTEYSIQVNTAGVYHFTLRDTILGCVTSDSVVVDDIISYPDVDAGEDVMLNCDPDTVLFLNGEIQLGTSNYSTIWETLNGEIIGDPEALSPEIGRSGTYVLSVLNFDNGCVSRDSVLIVIDSNQPETVLFQAQDEVCFGDNNGIISILESEGGTEPYQYLLDGVLMSDNLFVEDLSPGDYELRVIDANNCTLDTSFTIAPGAQVLSSIDSLIEIEYGEERTLYLLTNLSEDEIASIQWLPGDQLSCDSCLVTQIQGFESNTYQVTIRDLNNCESRSIFTLLVIVDKTVFVPNSFSPNADGHNDSFTIYSKNVTEINEMKIFNRWGDLVFAKERFPANRAELGWDGTHNSRELNPAVFAYVVEVTFIDGSTQIISGDVTLMK